MNDAWRLREFSSMIGRMYDAVVDPMLWPDVVELLCARFAAAAGMLNFHEVVGHDALLAIQYGSDAHYSQLYVEQYAQLNPIVSALLRDSGSGVRRIGDVMSAAEYTASRFYQEWAKPQAYGDLMGTVVHSDDRLAGVVCLARSDTTGPYEQCDIDELELVAEHLRRALTIGDLLETRKIANTMFENLLGEFATAVIVIDDGGAVRFINPLAERLLAESGAGAIVGGRLVLGSLCLADLTTSVRDRQIYVAALAPRAPDTRPIALTAVALRADAGREGGNPIAIFISGERLAAHPPAELLTEIYGLTGAELRVLFALLDGENPSTIAGRFGISVTTVRTHLTRLFDKTESIGQVDLVRKIVLLLPPIAVANTRA